jgi:hypothetical protein
MTRKAILLSASSPPTRIPGVQSDAEAWHRFLCSNLGGAWTNQEITRVANCDREATLAAVRATKGADYSLIVFAGQGEIRKGDLPWPEAHILLSDGGSLSERDLNSGTPRCTMVFDWSNRSSAEPAPAGSEADKDGVKCRNLFDQALEKAEGGLVKIYASTSDTAAGQGPSLSRLLLRTAQEWTRQNHGILSLQQAVSLVVDATQKTDPLLKAEYQGGRRLRHFPLSVSI